ncbi:MAG: hypothetical protein NT122_02530 [Solirubrobacterales bacterium]|nr:hypothetical protein [Solirubrobacterales bacterium]
MTFTAFLKATVLGCAASATLLAALALAGAIESGDGLVIPIAAVWWLVAGVSGSMLGRSSAASPAIGRLLADAKLASSLPEVHPARILLNRLWPLLIATVGAGGFVLLAPQVPAMAAGFPVIWALAWRRQEKAVQAIEERDGVRFFIEKTSPIKPIQLIRTPWFKSGMASRRGESDPVSGNGRH